MLLSMVPGAEGASNVVGAGTSLISTKYLNFT